MSAGTWFHVLCAASECT